MVLMGITIGIVILWGWYYWSVRLFRLEHNIAALITTGRTIQMAIRLALECIAQERYTDAQFHIDTAMQRYRQFNPSHPKTKRGADLLGQEIVVLQMMLHYAKDKNFTDAQQCVLLAAHRHAEFLAYTQVLKDEMDDYTEV